MSVPAWLSFGYAADYYMLIIFFKLQCAMVFVIFLFLVTVCAAIQSCYGLFKSIILFFFYLNYFLFTQVDDGVVLPDKTSLYLTAIEDAEYKDDKIECETINLLLI